MDGAYLYVYAIAVISLAYWIRGLAAFGSGLIAIPLLAVFFPLIIVVPCICALDTLASCIHGVRYYKSIVWKDLLYLFPTMFVGVLTSLFIIEHIDAEILRLALGIFVVAYSIYSILPLGSYQTISKFWAAPTGITAGSINTLIGTGGPIYVIYFALRKLNKTQFRANIATILGIDGFIRIVGFIFSGFYDQASMKYITIGLPIMMFFMFLGGRTHMSISQSTFDKIILGMLFVTGMVLIST
tara:strand:+ start:2176 stop:2901 length:726 start_codon:yes stop_codon:yes gene_type:complete